MRRKFSNVVGMVVFGCAVAILGTNVGLAKTLGNFSVHVDRTPEADRTAELKIVVVHDNGIEEYSTNLRQGENEMFTCNCYSNNLAIRVIEVDPVSSNLLGTIQLGQYANSGSRQLRLLLEQVTVNYTLY